MVLFVGYGAINRMEYLNAADMKKMTDKRNKEMSEEIMEKVQTKIFDAAKAGLYGVRVDILPAAITAKLKDMGYKITYDVRGDKEIIIWRK